MSAIKERIIGAVTVMSDTDAARVWDLILDNISPRSWEDIEAVAPDEWDEKMLSDIENDPDCHSFVSEADLIRELNA